MLTDKQQKTLTTIVEAGGNINKVEAMIQGGYSPNTAKTPSKFYDSPKVMKALEDSGLTESFILKALVEDIKGKPKKRIEELKLGAKIIGLSEDAGININFDNRRIIVTRGESGLVPKPTNEVAQTSPEPMGELPVQDTSGREEGA